MRELVVLLSAATLLSCAAGDKEARGSAPADKGSGEGDCLRSIAGARKHYCEDRPAEISEGYASRARERFDQLDRGCPGTRSRRALRDLDECVWAFENEPNQIDDDTKARRETARPYAAALKGDSVFQLALQKKRSAVDEADNAAQDYRNARAAGSDSNEQKFRKDAWDAAEETVKRAEADLRHALRAANVDPRDARFFGVW